MVLDIAKELEKTLHIHSVDLPYITVGFGTESRVLIARPKEGLFAIQFRAQPGVKSPLHKHRTPVIGFTLSGMWGHDDQYLYRPGTFIYETPGVIHQFINGPDVTEAVFVGDPNLDFVDPETLEVTGSYTGAEMIANYVQKCKEQGVEARFL